MQGETVTRHRGQADLDLQTLAPVQALVADGRSLVGREAAGGGYKLYLDEAADVVDGEELTVRGLRHVVDGNPDRRTGFALVVHTIALADLYDCRVMIGPAGTTPVFNAERRVTETTPAPAVYVGPAGLTPPTSAGTQTEAAGDDVTVTGYQLAIPRAAAPAVEVGHVATVLEAPHPALVGRRFRVCGFALQTRGPDRVLHVTAND